MSTIICEKFFLDNENGKRKADEYVENKVSKLPNVKGTITKSKNENPNKVGFLHVTITKGASNK